MEKQEKQCQIIDPVCFTFYALFSHYLLGGHDKEVRSYNYLHCGWLAALPTYM